MMSLTECNNYYDVITRHWGKSSTLCISHVTPSATLESVLLSPHIRTEAQTWSVTHPTSHSQQVKLALELDLVPSRVRVLPLHTTVLPQWCGSFLCYASYLCLPENGWGTIIISSIHVSAENHILGLTTSTEQCWHWKWNHNIFFQLKIPAWVLFLWVNLKIMWRLLRHMVPTKSVTSRGCLMGWKYRSRDVSIGLWKNVLRGNSQTS